MTVSATFDRRAFALLPALIAVPALSTNRAAPNRIGAAIEGALLGKSSGAALVAKRGHALWRGAIGTPGDNVAAPSVDSVFDALSIGKTFTAVAVLRLAELGQVDLGDRILKHLPELGAPFADLRVRHLLNNDTGLPTYLDGGDLDPRSADQALLEIASLHSDRKPGSGYRYSNVNFHLLGLMVERVAGQPLAEVVRRLVFRPAGMTNTGFFGEVGFGGARAAIGYVDGKPVGDTSSWPLTWSLLGAAGVGSTVTDLLRFNRHFLVGRGLQPGTQARLLLGGVPTYGRGPYVTKDTIDISYGAGLFHWVDRQGRHIAFHGGDGDFGFNAVMFWRAEDDLFFAALLNSRTTANPLDRGEMMQAILTAVDAR